MTHMRKKRSNINGVCQIYSSAQFIFIKYIRVTLFIIFCSVLTKCMLCSLVTCMQGRVSLMKTTRKLFSLLFLLDNKVAVRHGAMHSNWHSTSSHKS